MHKENSWSHLHDALATLSICTLCFYSSQLIGNDGLLSVGLILLLAVAPFIRQRGRSKVYPLIHLLAVAIAVMIGQLYA